MWRSSKYLVHLWEILQNRAIRVAALWLFLALLVDVAGYGSVSPWPGRQHSLNIGTGLLVVLSTSQKISLLIVKGKAPTYISR